MKRNSFSFSFYDHQVARWQVFLCWFLVFRLIKAFKTRNIQMTSHWVNVRKVFFFLISSEEKYCSNASQTMGGMFICTGVRIYSPITVHRATNISPYGKWYLAKCEIFQAIFAFSFKRTTYRCVVKVYKQTNIVRSIWNIVICAENFTERTSLSATAIFSIFQYPRYLVRFLFVLAAHFTITLRVLNHIIGFFTDYTSRYKL